jgi:hypothetical protein
VSLIQIKINNPIIILGLKMFSINGNLVINKKGKTMYPIRYKYFDAIDSSTSLFSNKNSMALIEIKNVKAQKAKSII